MQVSIYKSSKKDEMYLYVARLAMTGGRWSLDLQVESFCCWLRWVDALGDLSRMTVS